MEGSVQLDFNEYQRHVLSYARELPLKTDLLHASLGLVSEAGEIADALKATMIYGKPLDLTNMKEEVGDGLWFAGLTARLLQWDYQNDIILPGTVGRAAMIRGDRLIGYSLRLADAASAVSVRLADHAEDDYPIQLPAVKAELQRFVGFLWRISMALNFTLEEAAAANIAKLDRRYNKAGFSADAGLNRDKDAERAAIESIGQKADLEQQEASAS